MISPRVKVSAEDAALLLRGLLAVDVAQLARIGPREVRAHRLDPISLLRDGRGRYSPVDPREEWQTAEEMIRAVLARGAVLGDCEDWATFLAAWLRVTGIDPDALPIVYPSGSGVFHVVTLTRRGVLDPSRWGGMPALEGVPQPPPSWS